MTDERNQDEARVGRLPGAGTWDFALVIVTIALLGALGAQSLVGTLYAWWSLRADPSWESGASHAAFLNGMNAVAAPLLIALVVVMGLCVPKRLFSRRALVAVSAVMVAFGIIVGGLAGSVTAGLAAYLAVAGLVQVAVVVLTVSGARGLAYLSPSRLAKVGSGLLHLGFIGFALVVVALQRSPLMLPAFFVSSAALVGGSALSFYARGGSGSSTDGTGHRDAEAVTGPAAAASRT